ncbi:P-loop containing nucleoside triphosphate hydrolases superfamily protein [Actinidia rufa]|uniref:P-loop containing nucleoside triphosphate hydrolases superfamily protein n=1 Tax=Actinidia rufa TaxID=165716 RepID=A0A7J0H144_9ERIC|nr:P-loop containing nucleoside triphosphate hydrolases superfamily protein [Actinidia rufa]
MQKSEADTSQIILPFNFSRSAPNLTSSSSTCTLTTVSTAAGAVSGKRLSDVHPLFISTEELVILSAITDFLARIWAQHRSRVVQASLCSVSSSGFPPNFVYQPSCGVIVDVTVRINKRYPRAWVGCIPVLIPSSDSLCNIVYCDFIIVIVKLRIGDSSVHRKVLLSSEGQVCQFALLKYALYAPTKYSTMNLTMDHQAKTYGRLNSSSVVICSDIFEPTITSNGETEAKQRATVIEWLNSILPNLILPISASDEELRACLNDGTILCRILNRLRPGSVIECGNSDHPSESRSENTKRFLAAMDELKLPRFQISDLEKGSMKIVLECLVALRVQFLPNVGSPNKSASDASMRWKLLGQSLGRGDGSREELSTRAHPSTLSGDERRKSVSDSKFQRALRSSVMAEPSAALLHHVGHKFHEVFQLKHGCYADLPAAKISEMMKSNSLDNAPTQSLLSVVNGILDESFERKNGEIPHRVACLLRKVVQEIERRISTQAEHLRTQSNLFKAREEKYQSRIRVLEALATGTSEESQTEKTKIEENKKAEEQDVIRLAKEKDQINNEILKLKQEMEIARKENEECCIQMETEAKGAQRELADRLKKVTHLLTESRSRVKELEAYSESKNQRWNKKEHIYQIFTEFHLGALRELRFSSQSIKQEILSTQKSYSDNFQQLEKKLKALANASENYRAILAENRKIHNELQELKGNIRVYCRIRPFLPGQTVMQSIVESIGENGELTVANPSKQGKDAEVYSDIQPLIRSVLDGYNVCIFAYGQTGSGKTYTMTGPDGASEEDWGVNYRALNDLFRISQTRNRIFTYEVSVQMVEIYNEQVLVYSCLVKMNAVPDASMHPVTSTIDVVELMEIGLKNRAKGATALNERSSRSHSVVTIHVRGTDTKTGASLRGSLHLVDLAGSERVDRSEVTGDRLKEAQHINKSLSALGDVIFALSQKSAHVPYRNSKLTQVLQSSLGGHAKTLMFVQLNPELNSYSESTSTLKFAERVSGVELGAAKSSKEGRDVKELMDQVASLKDTIAKKDEEIERLQLLKDLKNAYQGVNGETRGTTSIKFEKTASGSSLPVWPLKRRH